MSSKLAEIITLLNDAAAATNLRQQPAKAIRYRLLADKLGELNERYIIEVPKL